MADDRACPCLSTTPCHERCTCVMPASSSGCRRCCSYGSAEQRAVMAAQLAEFIDLGWVAREGARDEHGGLAATASSAPRSPTHLAKTGAINE
jgi:hypothetical protein